MTRKEAIARLNDCIDNPDIDVAHVDADSVLIELLESLGYRDVANVWRSVEKWYS